MFGLQFKILCAIAFVLRYHWHDYDNLPFIAILILCVEVYESLFHWSFDIHISRPVAVIAITCLIWGDVDVYALSIGYFAYWCLWQLRGILFCILDKIVNRS